MEVIDVHVGDSPMPGILKVLQKIRPAWKIDDIIIKKMEIGLVNRMYQCELPGDVGHNDVIIIRVFGADTEYMDREKECLAVRMVHRAGLGAQVYCRFDNGLACKFLRGMHLDESNIKKEEIARAVAQKLASLHGVNIIETLVAIGEESAMDRFKEPFKWSDFIRKITGRIPEHYADATKAKIRRETFPSIEEGVAMVVNLEHELSAMNFPAAIGHGDPNPYNIVHNADTGEIHLIDWEFADLHILPMDIGIYFAGSWFLFDVAEESLALYPDKEYQLKWIRWYLEYQAELTGKDPDRITEEQVIHLYKGSINCALQYSQAVAFSLLGKDALVQSDPTYLRVAQNFQRLFDIILNDHYRNFPPTSVRNGK